MKNQKGVGFSLVKINTDQFSTLESQPNDLAKVDILANIDFGISSENKRVSCITKFEYQYDARPFIILGVSCEFQFNEHAWKALYNDSEIEFPQGLLQHLAVITIGTVRGVLHAKTENTDYNKFFLPTLNLTGMINENLKFPIE